MVDKLSSARSAQTPKAQAMSSSAQRRRAIRSHTGCITCRARKVKCDEKPGICANCERLHLECQKADGTKIAPPASTRRLSDPPLGEVGIKRKRTFRSCAQCRASKARCSGQKPECSRCRQRQVDCVYDEDSTPQWERVVQSSRGESSQFDASASESNSNNHRIIHEEHDAIEVSDRAATSDQSPLQTSRSMSIDRPILSITPLPGPSRTIPSRPSSVRGYAADEGPDSLEWLFKPQLPNRQRMRMLVKEFFENIHPLRCYAFIHRPSFIQHLDESSPEDHTRNGLLHIVCALGAKFYALQYTSSLKPLSSRMILSAGNDWAKRALSLLFLEIGTISVQNLMTAVLSHDHELRVGNYASAFMLTGTITRMAQALQLNLEFSTDIFHDEPNNGPSVCSKEARRRLMWSCYISDTLIGSGVDQLTLFHEPDLKIQLPCNERNFVLQVPCVTEMLTPGQFLPFVPQEQIPPRVIDNIGIVALYVRLIALRKQVLRYVKRLATSKPPWLPESEFAELDNALREWYAQLPPSLQFTRAALYTRRESSQLGAFVLLQCTYNWTTVDLYRIAMPKLYRLSLPWTCADDFRARLQETIFIHAQRCSTVLADASRHGIKTLADTWLPSIAFDGNRLMLYYVTQIVGLRTEKGQHILNECIPYCRSNLQLLGSMKSMSAMADSLYPRAEEMLKKVSTIQAIFLSSPDKERDTSGSGSVVSSELQLIGCQTREATPDGTGPDFVLQPTSVYKMARDSIPIQEKHASEKSRPQRIRAQHISSSAPTSPATSQGFQAAQPFRAPFGEESSVRQGTGLLQMDPNAPPMHEFDNFFSSGFDANWQPAEVTSAAFDGNAIGLPSWLPAMTDMYADLSFGPWPIGTDVMNGQPSGDAVGRNPPL